MKKMIALVCALLCLSGCLAESSNADDFLENLSNTWNSFLGMTQDAANSVSEWADNNGVTQWFNDTGDSIANWANENGVTQWLEETRDNAVNWYNQSGIPEWAEEAARDVTAFIDENRPAAERMLQQAGEVIARAWNTVAHPESYTTEEVARAYKALSDSIEGVHGVYDDVHWAIAGDTLFLGIEERTEAFAYREKRASADYPWNAVGQRVTDVQILGNLRGNGDMSYMFYGLDALKTVTIVGKYDRSMVTAEAHTYSDKAGDITVK